MSNHTKTIFALSTAPGKSGVAIFRISGPDSKKALEVLGVKKITPRLATLANFTHPKTKETLDKGLSIFFPSPHSFTGEDVAELHTHGSRAVINLITRTLASLPFLRLAEPGEFSRRALENGKLDLAEAEGLSDLINAETELQHKQALRQLSGEMSRLYEDWRAQIIKVLAHLEAYIDFPDEDIPVSVRTQFEKQAEVLKESIDFYLNDNRKGEILREGVHAVILGAPNAGKSSLMNYLAKREVAIVSDIAGTTRDVIEVSLDIDGYPLTIADTAGLRESTDQIEQEGIRRAKDRAFKSDFKIIILDASSHPDYPKQSLELIDENSIVLINKADLKAIPNGFKINNIVPIPVSVTTQKGLDAFFTRLSHELSERMYSGSSPVITRERHRRALENSSMNLEAFLSGLKNNQEIELSAEHLRLSARALGSITGKIEVDDILDSLFRTFCIGK